MRTPVTLKIKFKSASLDQFIERYSVDVSRGGIFIRTKDPLPVGTSLKFEFQLQDAQPLISGEGTVVWIREHDPTRTGVAPGMGVRFDRLAPQSQQILDKILVEKQRLDASNFEAKEAGRAPAGGTGLRASRLAMPGATPQPFPVPGTTGEEEAGFGPRESTRVMNPDQAEALTQRMREPSVVGPRPELPPPAQPPPARPRSAPRVPALPAAASGPPSAAQGPGTRARTPTPPPMPMPMPAAPGVIPAHGPPSAPPSATSLGTAPTLAQIQPPPLEPEASGLTVTLAPPPRAQQPPPAMTAGAPSTPIPTPSRPQARLATQPYLARISDTEVTTPSGERAVDSSDETATQVTDVPPPPPLDEPPAEEEVIPLVARKMPAGHEATEAGPTSQGNGESSQGYQVPRRAQSDWFSGLEPTNSGALPVEFVGRATPLAPNKERTEPVRTRESRSSLAPAVALIAVVLLAAGGYLVWRDRTDGAHPSPRSLTERGGAPATAPTAKAAPAAAGTPVAPATPTGPAAAGTAGQATAPVAAAPTTPTTPTPVRAGSTTAPAAPAAGPSATALAVRVTSTPVGAQVLVDSKEQPGTTPLKLEGLDPAKTYSVKVALKGYKPFETKLAPRPGADVAALLVPLPRWLAVVSTPPGATVLVDGRRVGLTPTTLKGLDSSKPHKLELKKWGFEEVARDVTAADDWQTKTDHTELAVDVHLVKKAGPPTAAPAPGAGIVRRPKRPARPTAHPPAETVEPAAGGENGEAGATEKPAGESAEKPAGEGETPSSDKADKPDRTSDKPDNRGEKPKSDKSEKPSDEDRTLKTPDWLKK